MPSAVEGVSNNARPRVVAALLLNAFGLGFTLFVFYPGVMTIDARYIYADIMKGFIGDWQSPMQWVLWKFIDPIAPGSASIFLLIVTIYWSAFALLSVKLVPRSWLAILLPLLALSPPAFVLVGTIWRDVLFAGLWLLAAALVLRTGEAALKLRLMQLIAGALVLLGVLLRPNSVPAAPLILAYVFWPRGLTFKRAILLYVPAFLACVALVPAVYYGLIGAKKQNPLHQIIVYDLEGISYYTQQNQFPVTWTPEQTTLLLGRCYEPDKWDGLWYLEPCKFVMGKLEKEEKVFGTPAFVDSWRHAVLNHPVAYLQHRFAFMRWFLTQKNLVMWTQDINNPTQNVYSDRVIFTRLLNLQESLRGTLVFTPITWLALCIMLGVLAWRRRETAEGAFVVGVCSSAAVYVSTYLVVGVASDYRYAYWAVLAGLASFVVWLVGVVNGWRDASVSDTA